MELSRGRTARIPGRNHLGDAPAPADCIVHIVTLLTPDGAFGGPARVAVDQVAALRRLGYPAILLAGSRGFGNDVPVCFDGVPVRLFRVWSLFPRLGFAGLVCPGMLLWIARNRAKLRLAHIHMARDLVTLPVTALLRALLIPFVTQTHGMIDSSKRFMSKPLDRLLTVPLLRAAKIIFTLSTTEVSDLAVVAGAGLKTKELSNGVMVDKRPRQHEYSNREVLFLGRLHAVKNPVQFVEMAIEVASVHEDVNFLLVGPDEGETASVLKRVAEVGLMSRIRWAGPVPPDSVADTLSRASILVCSSHSESFGMAIFEAMSAEVAVVIRRSFPISRVVEEAAAGKLYDGTTKDLVAQVLSYLSDPIAATTAGKNGKKLVREKYSMHEVMKILVSEYREIGYPESTSEVHE